MKTIKIVIERSKDIFSAYAENVEGIYGGGDTVAEAKQSVLNAICLLKENNTETALPKILWGDYKVSFRLDVESFFNYYNGIFTKAALERITGINQKQIQHYASGLKKPRPAQRKKIEISMHKLGEELIAIKL